MTTRTKRKSKPEPVLTVAQLDLVEVATRRRELAVAADVLRQRTGALETAEARVRALLAAGATVEPGTMTALLETRPGRFAPRWKELYVGEQASAHARTEAQCEEDARAAFPVSPVTVLVVGVRS